MTSAVHPLIARAPLRPARAARGSVVAALLAGGGLVGFAVARAMRGAERVRELSALSTHLQELAEKEKRELARNLHDELGGLLTAAKMDVSWLQGRAAAEPGVQQRLQQLGSVLDEAMDVKRRVVEDLRPSLLDHFGLSTALRAYLEGVSASASLACEFVSAAEEEFPQDVAIGLFRIVQEGLANVVRHSGAQHVRLELASDARAYSLRLEDDGRGFDLASPGLRSPYGIAGMRHRVRALGGRLSFGSSPGRGTTLSVEVPRRAQPDAADQAPCGADHLERPSATIGFRRAMSRILSRK